MNVSRRNEVYNQQEIRSSWGTGDRMPLSQLPNYSNCEQRPLKYGEIMVISAYPAATVISLEQNRTFDWNINRASTRDRKFTDFCALRVQ